MAARRKRLAFGGGGIEGVEVSEGVYSWGQVRVERRREGEGERMAESEWSRRRVSGQEAEPVEREDCPPDFLGGGKKERGGGQRGDVRGGKNR